MTDPTRKLSQSSTATIQTRRSRASQKERRKKRRAELRKERQAQEAKDALEAGRAKMEGVRVQLEEARRNGGWGLFGDPIENEYELFIPMRWPFGADAPEPDSRFWMAEPDGDLPIDIPLPWEIRPEAAAMDPRVQAVQAPIDIPLPWEIRPDA